MIFARLMDLHDNLSCFALPALQDDGPRPGQGPPRSGGGAPPAVAPAAPRT